MEEFITRGPGTTSRTTTTTVASMWASEYYEVNKVLREIAEILSQARYGSGHGGIIPPENILDVVGDVTDAYDRLLEIPMFIKGR